MFLHRVPVFIARRGASLGLLIVLLFTAWAFAKPVSESSSQKSGQVDSILILKKDHVMELVSGGKVIHTYKVALGRGGLAPKEREGDELTPEGHYAIDSRNEHSGFYGALHISYPNAEDRSRAGKLGVPPGGAIMIHGIKNGLGWLGAAHRTVDWTAGCIAVTNAEMDEIWKLVPLGTPVEIRP